MAGRKRLFTRLVSPYVVLILLSVFGLGWFGARFVREFHMDQLRMDLSSRAKLVLAQLPTPLHSIPHAQIDSLAHRLGTASETRITIIDKSGRVLGDSEENPAVMDNHAHRPEIIQALKEGLGSATRYSLTLKQTMLYIAVPVIENGEATAIVRVAVSIQRINQALHWINIRLGLGAIFAAIITAILSMIITRRITRPLEHMTKGAAAFASGKLKRRLIEPQTEELAALARAMNQMAQQLDERINQMREQQEELDAVLSSIVEGVLAIDHKKRVIIANRTIADLLGIDSERATGQLLRDAVPNEDVVEFMEKVLREDRPMEDQIVLRQEGNRTLQMQGTAIRGHSGKRQGAVVVFNDITALLRLENTRREFVANVSHELKTPITSIKGFVETLRDGAVNHPEDAEHFLKIIARQADHLTAIVDDLLSLTRIEKETESRQIQLELFSVRDVLTESAQLCEPAAAGKNQKILVECAEDIIAPFNVRLLQQAIVNLIDNAIKYSPPGKRILIDAENCEYEVAIRVRDEGPGIASEHLPRLFERFYRVDKSRSRKFGGTGLGLAIVKHIALAHGGSVDVDTQLGKGSVFTFHLPKPNG